MAVRLSGHIFSGVGAAGKGKLAFVSFVMRSFFEVAPDSPIAWRTFTQISFSGSELRVRRLHLLPKTKCFRSTVSI